MIMKSGDVMGKVQYEDLQIIWNVYLPHPKEIESLCEKYMKGVSAQHMSNEEKEFNKLSKWKQFLQGKPSFTVLEESSLKNIHTFFSSDLFVECENFDYFQQMYESAQMIKLTLKLKRVAAKCSNNIYAEEKYLTAIKDVVNHLDYYENILKDYRKDFDIK